MKSIYSIILATLLCSQASAQYFQHKYGYAPDIGTRTKCGQVTTASGPGHLVGADHIRNLASAAGDYGVYVLRTDQDGRFSSGNNFNRVYFLTHVATGIQTRFTTAFVVEFSDGSGYGAIGTYVTQTGIFAPYQNQGIAYIRLDLMGNVMNVQGYSLANSSGALAFIAGLKESTSSPNTLFATGTLNDDGSRLWAMHIDQAGNLLWGNFYDISSGTAGPTDLVESPYASELIIVGDYDDATWSKPFWMVLNPNTGAFVRMDAYSTYMGGVAERMRSINVTPGDGFILTGISDAKALVVKLGNGGWYQWAGLYSSATNPGFLMYGHDAVGGVNATTGRREYYVTGPYFNEPINGDAYMFKLDANGFPVNPNGLFLYNTGVEETGMAIDWSTGGVNDGITMYAIGEGNGTPGSPLKEVYVVKADFNGQSGCHEYFEDLQRQITEWGSVKKITAITSGFGLENLAHRWQLDLVDNELCFTGTRPGGGVIGTGRNTAMSTATVAQSLALLSPNPSLAGSGFKVQIDLSADDEVQIAVYDITGRTCQSTQLQGKAGHNVLPLQAGINMPTGIYTVKVKGRTIDQNLMLSIQ